MRMRRKDDFLPRLRSGSVLVLFFLKGTRSTFSLDYFIIIYESCQLLFFGLKKCDPSKGKKLLHNSQRQTSSWMNEIRKSFPLIFRDEIFSKSCWNILKELVQKEKVYFNSSTFSFYNVTQEHVINLHLKLGTLDETLPIVMSVCRRRRENCSSSLSDVNLSSPLFVSLDESTTSGVGENIWQANIILLLNWHWLLISQKSISSLPISSWKKNQQKSKLRKEATSNKHNNSKK